MSTGRFKGAVGKIWELYRERESRREQDILNQPKKSVCDRSPSKWVTLLVLLWHRWSTVSPGRESWGWLTALWRPLPCLEHRVPALPLGQEVPRPTTQDGKVQAVLYPVDSERNIHSWKAEVVYVSSCCLIPVWGGGNLFLPLISLMCYMIGWLCMLLYVTVHTSWLCVRRIVSCNCID